MSFITKRTMERSVEYFMASILQQAEHYCRAYFCGCPMNKNGRYLLPSVQKIKGISCYFQKKSFEPLLFVRFSTPYLSNIRSKISISLGDIFIISKPILKLFGSI